MGENKSFFSEHATALIGGFTAIVGAVISGVFLLMSQSHNEPVAKGENTPPTLVQPEKASPEKPHKTTGTPPAGKDSGQPVKTPVSLAGCWNWSNGAYIIIRDDGSVLNGAVKAVWKTRNLSRREYVINWPPLVDSLTLSDNGTSLSGMNNVGWQFSAGRLEGEPSTLVGKWKWSNGLGVIITPDGKAAAGPLRGNWSRTNGTWTIEWPVNDTIFMSKDGQSLSITNQFGSVSASRDRNCNP